MKCRRYFLVLLACNHQTWHQRWTSHSEWVESVSRTIPTHSDPCFIASGRRKECSGPILHSKDAKAKEDRGGSTFEFPHRNMYEDEGGNRSTELLPGCRKPDVSIGHCMENAKDDRGGCLRFSKVRFNQVIW